jgi:hypothetical protein
VQAAPLITAAGHRYLGYTYGPSDAAEEAFSKNVRKMFALF